MQKKNATREELLKNKKDTNLSDKEQQIENDKDVGENKEAKKKEISKMSVEAKLWFGPYLHIITSRPKDADQLLTNFLEKSSFFRYADMCFGNGLVTSQVEVWRGRKKMIIPTFNQKILNSYTDALQKHSKRFVSDVEKSYDGNSIQLLPKIWKHSLDGFCETFADIDADLVVGQDQYLTNVRRFEELVLERCLKPWLYPNFTFKHSPLGKETTKLSENIWPFVTQLMNLKKMTLCDNSDDDLKKKRHLNHLFSLLAEKYMEEEDVAAELQNMILASTETTSYSSGFTFLALAMHPEIQKNVQNELDSIFGTSDRDITLEDVINMEYLERVIKESLRLFPSVPFVMRNIDKTIEIDSHVFPAGADIVVAIMNIHMRPDLWPDPWKFDPDRFLPEEAEKRHRCAFMPFGHGSRVCAGVKIAMTMMKITLSTLLRKYDVKPVLYKSLKEIQLDYAVFMMPKDECQVVLEKRKK
ncbi:hypothetical protein GEV33_006325 [Tenebrio molitor]|uniref:Cytochrome P450 monooxygenase n=1 Tax=Tenebrio molitor TaxID=7067 RepID=A0A8J6HLB3_TENMO|nr:hypothetical protein GEV33_006325 [Tenebrio molitor]